MKKALALVLALVLALSLGVSAFALQLVPVKPESGKKPADILDISDAEYDLGKEDSNYGAYLVGAEGGVFYVQLKDKATSELKNIEVSATGNVTAKVVPYTPENMVGAEADWYVTYNGEDINTYKFDSAVWTDIVSVWNQLCADLKNTAKRVNACQREVPAWYKVTATGLEFDRFLDDTIPNTGLGNATEATYYQYLLDTKVANPGEQLIKDFGYDAEKCALKPAYVFDPTVDPVNTQELAQEYADRLNEALKTSRFHIENKNVDDIYVLEITVGENYTASYKEGSVKITADEVERDAKGKITKKTKVGATLKIVSDVTIFEIEDVKAAGKYEDVLHINSDKGYSAYLNAGSYGEYYYNEWANRLDDDATVIATTAFSALRKAEDGIVLESKGGSVVVEIPEIGGQRGVNFNGYDVAVLTAAGLPASQAKGNAKEVVFGFYGDQTIASNFTVEAYLGVTAYELREYFGKAMEEDEVVTYYVLEGDHVVDTFTVDYSEDEIDEDLVLEINRAAGSTLGQYSIVVEAPATAPEKGGEENPNTGAESVLGVVAAMAVVSVAAAAAVSLKK